MITRDAVLVSFATGSFLTMIVMLENYLFGKKALKIFREKQNNFDDNFRLATLYFRDVRLFEIVVNEILNHPLTLEAYKELYKFLQSFNYTEHSSNAKRAILLERTVRDWDALTDLQLEKYAGDPASWYDMIIQICNTSRRGCQSRERILSKLLDEKWLQLEKCCQIFELAAMPETRSKAINAAKMAGDDWLGTKRLIDWCMEPTLKPFGFMSEERREYLDRLYLQLAEVRHGKADLLLIVKNATENSPAWRKAVMLLAQESATEDESTILQSSHAHDTM